MPEDEYSTIREHIGHCVGQRIVDITQQDEQEFAETGESYVMLLLENGDHLKFPIRDEGFEHTEREDACP